MILALSFGDNAFFNCSTLIFTMIRKAIYHFDLFTAPATLRIKGETDKANACSGVFSIFLYIAFTAIFVVSVIEIFEYKKIQSQIIDSVQKNSTAINNFPFAIGLLGMNISQYNNVLLTVSAYLRGSKTVLSFEPCTLQFLPGLSSEEFEQLNVNTYLCVKEPQKISLYRFFTHEQSTYLQVVIAPCDPLQFPETCAPNSEELISNISTIMGGRFIASFIPLTTGFNPSEKNATFKLFEKAGFYMVFSDTAKSEHVQFVSRYIVKSDESVLPYQLFSEESGHYIDQTFPIYSFRQPGQFFFTAYIFASPKLKTIQRVYGKIDDVLSYFGGLFGIVFSFFSIFMMSFNEYRYELEVADGNFSMENDRVKEKHMHFFKYVKYTLYDWIKILFCCQPNWDDCQRIQAARDEAVSQLEVCQLLRRITNLQKMYKEICREKDSELLHYLFKPDDISTAARSRLIKDYVDKMNDHDQSPTIYDLDVKKELLDMKQRQSLKRLNIVAEKNESSINIIQDYLKQYSKEINQSLHQMEFSGEDLEAEESLAEMFWELKEEKRKKVFRNIPINILYRIFEKHKKNAEKNMDYDMQMESKMESKHFFDSSAQIFPK